MVNLAELLKYLRTNKLFSASLLMLVLLAKAEASDGTTIPNNLTVLGNIIQSGATDVSTGTSGFILNGTSGATTNFSVYAGNPNGTVSCTSGATLWDISTPAIWQCQSGTTWSKVGGGTISGTNGYYAIFTSSSALGTGHIIDNGSFGSQTEFTNSTNLFDHGMQVNQGLYLGDGTSLNDSYAVFRYANGVSLGGGVYNLELIDDQGGPEIGVGGDLRLSGNVGTTEGSTVNYAADIKAYKETSTANDDTFDLLLGTWNAGTYGTNMWLYANGSVSALNTFTACSTCMNPSYISGSETDIEAGTTGGNVFLGQDFPTTIGIGSPSTVVGIAGVIALQGSVSNGTNTSDSPVIDPDLTTPLSVSGCGTSPTVHGNRNSGYIAIGTGGASSCAVSWGTAAGALISCTPTCRSSGQLFGYSPTTSGLTLTGVFSSGVTFDWNCKWH
jgi:hypothetical protein